jgi:GxxExxY protein
MKDELTEKVIGAAYRVYNVLGHGFLESVYEKSLLLELIEAGLRCESQKSLRVHYRGKIVGDFYADLLVEETLIVELKSVQKLSQVHEVQLVNYLTVTGLELGLLLNFGEGGVEVRRKVRVLQPGS